MDMTTNGKLMMGGMRNQSKPFLLIKKKKKKNQSKPKIVDLEKS
jgi:hypothetical protein